MAWELPPNWPGWRPPIAGSAATASAGVVGDERLWRANPSRPSPLLPSTKKTSRSTVAPEGNGDARERHPLSRFHAPSTGMVGMERVLFSRPPERKKAAF